MRRITSALVLAVLASAGCGGHKDAPRTHRLESAGDVEKRLARQRISGRLPDKVRCVDGSEDWWRCFVTDGDELARVTFVMLVRKR